MLQFFRKYQKIFFIFIAIVIIVSFTFFGVVTGPSAEETHVKDQPVGKKVNGSALMQRERDNLVHILGSSVLDPSSGREFPSLMNGGVLQREWLATGFATITARHDFPLLKPAFEERIVKILSFKPYAHPQDPSLSALSIYGKYAPKVADLLTRIQKASDPLSLDAYLLLIQLYLAERDLPPDFLREVLLYEENARGLQHDPVLDKRFLGLFGFGSLEEWFGKVWLEKAAEYVLHVAALSESQGYFVSPEEVRATLYKNIATHYKQVLRKESMSAEELSHYLQLERQRLQMSEQELFKAWQNIVLFERLLADVGSSTFLDALTVQTFQSFSKQAKSVELIEVKKPLRLKNLQDLFLLETYLGGISASHQKQENLLNLPSADPIDQLVKRTPELVERTYEIEYKKASKEEVLGLISTKETWEWELDKSHFAKIQEKFSFPAKNLPQTEEGRFQFLGKLSSKERLAVDQFARDEMLKSHPEKIRDFLDSKPSKKLEMSLRASGGKIPLEGVKNTEALKKIIVEAPLGAKDPVEYTEDGNVFYRIQVLSRKAPTLLSFEAAKQDGTLAEIFNARLETLYEDLKKKKHPVILDKSRKVVPLARVKDEVGKILYADLLKAIESAYTNYFGKPFPSHEDYAAYRFLQPLLEEKSLADGSSTLPAEWQFSKAVVSLSRSSPYPFAKEEMFSLPLKTWSSVGKAGGGNLAVYRVLESAAVDKALEAPVLQGQELLARDARRSFILDLLKQIDAKK